MVKKKRINNVEEMFDELKQKKLIEKNMQLKKSEIVLNFQADPFGRKIIWYNPKYSNIKKESLKFLLLHEIGHHKIGRIRGAFLVFLFLTCLIVFISIIMNQTITGIFVFSILFVLFFFGLKIWGKKEELASDCYAMKEVIKAYKIKDLEKYLNRVFRELSQITNKNKNSSKILQVMDKIFPPFNWLIRYHPNDEERISYVIRNMGVGK